MGLNQSQTGSCKNKGATDCSVAPGSVPSPRYFANFLLHDGVGQAGRRNGGRCRSRSWYQEPEHGILH